MFTDFTEQIKEDSIKLIHNLTVFKLLGHVINVKNNVL